MRFDLRVHCRERAHMPTFIAKRAAAPVAGPARLRHPGEGGQAQIGGPFADDVTRHALRIETARQRDRRARNSLQLDARRAAEPFLARLDIILFAGEARPYWRRVGKEGVSMCSFSWSSYHSTRKTRIVLYVDRTSQQ